jgi:hypothetical protein
MSPKKTRRGGRYTVRVNRDGTQQYARRGCFTMILTAVFIVVGSTVAAVCTLAMGIRGML